MIRYTLLLFFGLASPCHAQQAFKLSTFTEVPDDMYGCGDALYLNKKDKKAGRMLYANNFEDAMLKINGKLLRFKTKQVAGKLEMVSGKYRLNVKASERKQEDDEYYTFTAVLTVYEGAKIVFKQNVIGDGGC
ncbi:hypothetical protein [Mucilaginibacter pedocola]|uniref:Uncharacterized protein n=1 Tax=Mucilaginibacter pedocola TaxID=1792845 RepID=A0A1S9PCC9_9SPHI|nr:hypothetical protein [Mucilaginibacter pedocola]OOQ58644.1 hypothetical protein BC343_08235 [Mucilaginibacter pedocola]